MRQGLKSLADFRSEQLTNYDNILEPEYGKVRCNSGAVPQLSKPERHLGGAFSTFTLDSLRRMGRMLLVIFT